MTKKQIRKDDEEVIVIDKLDASDSGDLCDKLYDQFFAARSITDNRRIRSLYEQVAAHHNKLVGFKRYLPTIRNKQHA